MKRVFIIHGWGGHPKKGWLAWLGKELKARGFEVSILAMPDTDEPKIEKWVPFLAKQVKKADKETYFVGHSIGCQTILRYLETINEKVGGAIFVAGWQTLTGLSAEEKLIATPWEETQMDFGKIKKATKNFVAIFSDNDPYVPLTNIDIFRDGLGAKIIIEKKKGHFTEGDKVLEIPIVLKELLKMSS